MMAQRRPAGRLVLHGIISGLLAGLVFILAEQIMNVVLGKPFFGPPRLIASIILGKQAAMPTYPLAPALLVGYPFHLILAMLFGLITVGIYGALAFAVPRLATSTLLVLLYGAIAGCILWIADFLIIAPALWPQFTMVNQFWNGFIAHTVFFGLVIGAYITALLRPTRAAAQASGRVPSQEPRSPAACRRWHVLCELDLHVKRRIRRAEVWWSGGPTCWGESGRGR